MNQNIPYILGYVRNTYLHNLEKIEGFTECYIFGVKCLLNRPLSFHCQLVNGAVFWSLPISAFVLREDAIATADKEIDIIDQLLWWNCQSSDCDVTVFHYLEGSSADLKSRTGIINKGKYLFTIDDFYDARKLPLGYAQDTDAKCFHVFALDKGWLAAYPNDKILWYNPNFIDRTLPIPRYKAWQNDLRAENV